MSEYRKKPVVIQAFQMTRERRASNADWPEWMHKAWNVPYSEAGALYPSNYPRSDGSDALLIRTLEGVHEVSWGDWIIRGVAGELYPIKNDIFLITYEPVDVADREGVARIIGNLRSRANAAHGKAPLSETALMCAEAADALEALARPASSAGDTSILDGKLGNTPTRKVLQVAADMLDEAAQRLGFGDMPVVATKLRTLAALTQPEAPDHD